MNPHSDTSDSVLEERLRQYYTLTGPPPGLRDRVLSAAEGSSRLPRFEMALRWALAALVVTVAWAHWMERRTGERMARLASSVTQEASSPALKTEKEPVGGFLVSLFRPRARLPLVPGCTSTRLPIVASSLSLSEPGGLS